MSAHMLHSLFQKPKLWFSGAKFSSGWPFRRVQSVTYSSKSLSRNIFRRLSAIETLRHVQLLDCTFLLPDLLLLESSPTLLTLSLRGSRIEFGDLSPGQVASKLQRFPELATILLDSGVGSIEDWENVVDELAEMKCNLCLIVLGTSKGSQKMNECFEVAATVLEKEFGAIRPGNRVLSSDSNDSQDR